VYPNPPLAPAAGQPITDAYTVALTKFANETLGLATADRHRHVGEISCLRGMQKAGQIR